MMTVSQWQQILQEAQKALRKGRPVNWDDLNRDLDQLVGENSRKHISQMRSTH